MNGDGTLEELMYVDFSGRLRSSSTEAGSIQSSGISECSPNKTPVANLRPQAHRRRPLKSRPPDSIPIDKSSTYLPKPADAVGEIPTTTNVTSEFSSIFSRILNRLKCLICSGRVTKELLHKVPMIEP